MSVKKKLSREEVREMFPKVTAFADAIRAEFGSGVKLVYARENGREIGAKSVHDPERVVKGGDMCFDSLVVDDDKPGKRRAK